MEKSHVGMEYKICIVTGKKYSTGSLLLDTRLQESLEKEEVTGWGLCPEVEKYLNDGFVALIGIDPEQSSLSEDNTISPGGAYRTGNVAYVKRHVFDKMVGKDKKYENVKYTFVEDEVINFLNQLKEDNE